MMTDHDGLICAYRLDGAGSGRLIGWQEIEAPEEGLTWIHLHREGEKARQWLKNKSGIDPLFQENLLSEENQPRRVSDDNGLFLTMRGVNLNPGADPDDMIYINLWVGDNRIVTVRTQHLMAIEDIREALASGDGPKGPGDFIVLMLNRLVVRMEPILTALDQNMDDFEEMLLEGGEEAVRDGLGKQRQALIGLRRFLTPQRDILNALMEEQGISWIDAQNHRQIREAGARTHRYIGDIEAARDRAMLIQDELSRLLNERMNRAMYMLSVVTGIFLPLGLLTGLLGINVGGMPGVDSNLAFWFVCLILLTCAGFGIWLLKLIKWI